MSDFANRKMAIFTEAAQLPAARRAAYLREACGADSELRRQVEALLDANDRAGMFLENSPVRPPIEARREPPIGEKPGDRIGRYKLLEQIGEGGWGIVFMAEQEEPVRRKVALKIVKPGMDTRSVVARFEAERQALAMMDHPNIAHVFDAGATDSGRPYFVMELVHGVKITDYCDQHSLTTSARLTLFIQVCDAVQHAHQKGIIHRDIKPSNILVSTTDDGKAYPKVIDFGIAKATTGQKLTEKTLFTAFEMLIGTPSYMSPEQAALTNVEVDTRTDIYSLGVLLYELLTGTTPFNTRELLKAGLDEVRRVIRTREPLRPSTRLVNMAATELTVLSQRRQAGPAILIRELRGDLDCIVMKALEKDPCRRYATANGLATDVSRYMAAEAIMARPPSRVYKFQKIFSRNRFLFVGTGTFALLLVAGLILVSISFERERQARRESDNDKLQAQEATKFLEDMLRGVGPSVARGRDTALLREILDRTAVRIGTELTNQPAVEAEMDSLIGQLYRQVGKYNQAESIDRSAVALDRELYSEDNAGLAATLDELGLVLMSQGKPSEAAQAEAEGLAIRRRLFGEESAVVATSLNDLAHAEIDSGKISDAQKMTMESLGIRQKLFGNESLEAADSLRNLTIILGDEGKWTESEATARKVLEIRRKFLGSEHPWVASALDDLAWAVGAQGKKSEAQALEDEEFTMQQKLLPQGDPDIGASLYLVGDRLRQRGDLDQAASILNAALSIQAKALGDDNPATLHTLKSLGSVYMAKQNGPEAETIFRKELAGWVKQERDSEPNALYALRDLSDALEIQDKWPEAEALDRKALASWRKRVGETNAQTVYTLRELGLNLDAQKKWPEAESVQREQVVLWQKLAANDDPQTLFALRDLGSTLQNAGQFAEAEAVRREELTVWRKRVGNDDPQTLYTLDNLGWTLECEGKLPEAESIYQEALAGRRKQAGNDNAETLSEYDRVAGVQMRQGEYGQLEQLLADELTPALISQPSSCALLNRRVDLMGRLGRWQEAATAAFLVVKYQPTDQFRWHTLAALLGITRNRLEYEAVCGKILATFTNTSDPYIDERVVDDCLFLPDSGVDYKTVEEFADKAVSLGVGSPEALPYFQTAKAMSAYRMGNFAQAIEWAKKPLNSPIIYPKAHAYAVLAMAYWKCGQKDLARMALERGDLLTPNISYSSHKPIDLGDSWVAWLGARISLNEADSLIQSASRTESNSQMP